MKKNAQVCKSMHKYAKACTSMQKHGQVCKIMQKVSDFFLPFWKFVTTFQKKISAFFKFCVDFFLPFLTFLDVLRWLSSIFCFVCYAVQSSSRQYKMLSPFFLGGCIKAIPRTALLLSKIQSWLAATTTSSSSRNFLCSAIFDIMIRLWYRLSQDKKSMSAVFQ